MLVWRRGNSRRAKRPIDVCESMKVRLSQLSNGCEPDRDNSQISDSGISCCDSTKRWTGPVESIAVLADDGREKSFVDFASGEIRFLCKNKTCELHTLRLNDARELSRTVQSPIADRALISFVRYCFRRSENTRHHGHQDRTQASPTRQFD